MYLIRSSKKISHLFCNTVRKYFHYTLSSNGRASLPTRTKNLSDFAICRLRYENKSTASILLSILIYLPRASSVKTAGTHIIVTNHVEQEIRKLRPQLHLSLSTNDRCMISTNLTSLLKDSALYEETATVLYGITNFIFRAPGG